MTLTQLRVSVAEQALEMLRDGVVAREYPVSTSRFGTGFEPGSFRTPLGRHRIAEKIGAGLPPGAVLRSRVWTGQIWTPGDSWEADEDLVLTRVLWLDGLEAENAGSYSRYIYIHGTNHEEWIGTPASHGCVRMRNADVIELFDAVAAGDEVWIVE